MGPLVHRSLIYRQFLLMDAFCIASSIICVLKFSALCSEIGPSLIGSYVMSFILWAFPQGFDLFIFYGDHIVRMSEFLLPHHCCCLHTHCCGIRQKMNVMKYSHQEVTKKNTKKNTHLPLKMVSRG